MSLACRSLKVARLGPQERESTRPVLEFKVAQEVGEVMCLALLLETQHKRESVRRRRQTAVSVRRPEDGDGDTRIEQPSPGLANKQNKRDPQISPISWCYMLALSAVIPSLMRNSLLVQFSPDLRADLQVIELRTSFGHTPKASDLMLLNRIHQICHRRNGGRAAHRSLLLPMVVVLLAWQGFDAKNGTPQISFVSRCFAGLVEIEMFHSIEGEMVRCLRGCWTWNR